MEELKNHYDTNIRWVVSNGKIVLGPNRKYEPKTLQCLAILIMVVSVVMFIIFGSKIIIKDDTVITFLTIICLMLFMHGSKLNKVYNDSKEVFQKRQRDIINAENYAKKRIEKSKKR